MTRPEMEGFVLQFFRLDTPFTQSGFARSLGVTASAVSRWERGSDQIPPDLLPKALKLVSLPLEDFLFPSSLTI